MPKTTLASVLVGIVTIAAALALTVIEWLDDRPIEDRVRALARVACAVVVLLTCASSTAPRAAVQFQPVTTLTVAAAVQLKGAHQ